MKDEATCHKLPESHPLANGILSPQPLWQELLSLDDPAREWKILVGCICFNKTKREYAEPFLVKIFDRYPTAESMAEEIISQIDADATSPGETHRWLSHTLKPLGLVSRRVRAITNMTMAYVTKDWALARELPGVGKYGHAAWKIFHMGVWEGKTDPQDRSLCRYVKWLETQEKV